MPSKKIRTPIETGFVYHIYNRGHNYQNVFFQDSDYCFFIEKMTEHLSGYCSFYAYSLLPNHYHILLRVNEELEKNQFSQQYLKFILAYTNHINWREKRSGGLFLNPFRRIKVDVEDYLKRLFFYIHYNPVKHEIIDDFRVYKHSSYQSLLWDKPSNLARIEVLDIFGGLEGFMSYHDFLLEEKKIKELILEE